MPWYSKQTLCAVLPFAGLLCTAPVVIAYDNESERYNRGDRYSDEDRYDRENRYGREERSARMRMNERNCTKGTIGFGHEIRKHILRETFSSRKSALT